MKLKATFRAYEKDKPNKRAMYISSLATYENIFFIFSSTDEPDVGVLNLTLLDLIECKKKEIIFYQVIIEDITNEDSQ